MDARAWRETAIPPVFGKESGYEENNQHPTRMVVFLL
jgi:hypothetical protein